MPFLTRTAAGIGRYALRSGGKLLEDLQSGTDLKTAAKARLDDAKRVALDAVKDTLISAGQSGTGIRRRRKRKLKQIGGRRTKRIRSREDIFG